MSTNKFAATNGKDRRKDKPRRKGKDRRDAERATEKGVLSTRTGERRKQTRRATDRKAES
ncbi:MAG: hypothetical protein AB1757_28560 [Acidobacteriota bacterium]